MKIILASASPRRKELLEKAGLNISVKPSKITEGPNTCTSVEHYCLSLALSKAENIASTQGNAIIIAADTIVVLNNKIFGKPKNIRDAQAILSALNGTKHFVFTAIAVINTKENRKIVDIEKSTIFTRKLSSPQILMLSKKNHDKAGAYAIQEKSDMFIRRIEGDFYNVVGLPINNLRKILLEFNIKMGTLKQRH
ncbi:MAG: septum formation protein Maf [Candidatus Omnitrophica bacterium]|nr:septum formation protein Maf [Candidatus Omnitrophota bacterium]